MHKSFSSKEMEILRNLYMEGRLSKEEERALYVMLASSPQLSKENLALFHLMKTERKSFTGNTGKNARRHFFSVAAASILLLVSITFFSIGFFAPSHQEANYTVWQNGEKLSDEESKKIAEENQQSDMEMIRQVMRSQREMLKRNFASVNMEEYEL